MNNPDDFTEAELDALDVQSQFPNRQAKDELVARLQRQLDRLRVDNQKLALAIKARNAAGESFDDELISADRMQALTGKIQSKLKRLQNPQTGITSITIENFKGISTPVTVPLRPITLLFGANSAGKSTILQALHYARELLERNNANADTTLQGGDAIELGGFRNIVHKHDLNRSIRIRLDLTPTADGVPTIAEIQGLDDEEMEYDIPPRLLQQWSKNNEGILEKAQEFAKLEASRLNINSHVELVSIELVSRWDMETQSAWLAECNYWLNGRRIICLNKAKPSSRPSFDLIDYFHPAFLAMDEGLVEDQKHYLEALGRLTAEQKRQFPIDSLRACQGCPLGFDLVRRSTGKILAGKNEPFTPLIVKVFFDHLADVECLPDNSLPESMVLRPVLRLFVAAAVALVGLRQRLNTQLGIHPPIELPSVGSVVPHPEKPLRFPIEALGENRGAFYPVINQIVVGITNLASQQLQGLRYIGPIRAVPNRNHEAPSIPNPARWADGLAAWDELLHHYSPVDRQGDEFVKAISQWFSERERLGLGYRIEVSAFRRVDENAQAMKQLRSFLRTYEERSGEALNKNVLQPIEAVSLTPRIRIIDTRTETEVGPKDIGVGVAQALPVVVGALDTKCPLLAVEQPELHLHPAAQARLGDLLASQAKNGRLFLIETHSETLMLRIFRRMRETTRSKLPRPELAIHREEVALLFVSASDTGTRISEIRLDEQGKFVDSVPGGFFEEGFAELF